MTKLINVQYTKRFNKDRKLAIKRGYNIQKLIDVIKLIMKGNPLPLKYYDHSLMGNYTSYRECHIEPDWLLIYKIESDTLTLILSRTGAHSDLF